MTFRKLVRRGLLALVTLPFGVPFSMLMVPAHADQVINDDLIVQFSVCIGNDCVNGENFGFDTLRLKENNLRINFDDTSTTASFPRNDWRIVVNDTGNGGSSHFSIEDSTAGRSPFRIDAGAPADSLRVTSAGRVGIGTATPTVQLQVTDGNSPTLRLEQNGSNGFTPQTWDIAGNEANFFVRDVTNGSDLPFRIFPNAGTDALVIEGGTGDIGIGTNSPNEPVHVRRTNGTAKIFVEETASGVSELFKMTNNGGSFFTMENTQTAESWFILHEDNMPNGLLFQHAVAGVGGAVEFDLEPSGNLTISGALTQNSDRNNKTDIVSVDSYTILDQVSQLPISEWSYKDDSDTRHIGPMAQDFYSLFGTGRGETGISTIDTSGVALASIKALYSENQALKARLDKLEKRIDSQNADSQDQ